MTGTRAPAGAGITDQGESERGQKLVRLGPDKVCLWRLCARRRGGSVLRYSTDSLSAGQNLDLCPLPSPLGKNKHPTEVFMCQKISTTYNHELQFHSDGR